MASKKKSKLSRAIVAGLGYLTLNACLSMPFKGEQGAQGRAGDQIQRSLADAASAYGSAYWATKGAPVALIGSSLVVAPLWASDVARGHFMKSFDHHHQSLHMQNQLWQHKINKDVISLATPGQFVSDTYLIVDKYFKGKQKPSILIYGVAPRDFCDSTTDGIHTTIFDQLASLGDMPKVKELYLSTFDEHFNFILNRSIFLYHKRNRYQSKVEEAADKVAVKLFGPGKIAKNRALGGDTPFLMGTDHDKIWERSVAEYKERYRQFNQKQFDKQKACFDALLALCKERGIKLYVVAMPLTRDNMALMPAELNSKFRETVTTLTAQHKIPFVDLATIGGYKDGDFYDTVHLSMVGGDRFINQLSDIVESSENGEPYTADLITSKKMLAMPKGTTSPTY